MQVDRLRIRRAVQLLHGTPPALIPGRKGAGIWARLASGLDGSRAPDPAVDGTAPGAVTPDWPARCYEPEGCWHLGDQKQLVSSPSRTHDIARLRRGLTLELLSPIASFGQLTLHARQPIVLRLGFEEWAGHRGGRRCGWRDGARGQPRSLGGAAKPERSVIEAVVGAADCCPVIVARWGNSERGMSPGAAQLNGPSIGRYGLEVCKKTVVLCPRVELPVVGPHVDRYYGVRP
jgi:hypothetical protein